MAVGRTPNILLKLGSYLSDAGLSEIEAKMASVCPRKTALSCCKPIAEELVRSTGVRPLRKAGHRLEMGNDLVSLNNIDRLISPIPYKTIRPLSTR